MPVKPTTATLAQSLWRKKRLLTQQVLQAIGKTHPSNDTKFKLALDNYVAYIGHIRQVAARLDAQRAALLAFHAASTTLFDAVSSCSSDSPWDDRANLDRAMTTAVKSLQAKADALEALEGVIKARGAAKLELDSLSRLKSPRVEAATKLLEMLTDRLFREFAHAEAHRDQVIADDVAMAQQAVQTFLASFPAPTPLVVSPQDLQAREDELLTEYMTSEPAASTTSSDGPTTPSTDGSTTSHSTPEDQDDGDPFALTVVPLSPTAPRRATFPKAPPFAKSTLFLAKFKRFSTHLKPGTTSHPPLVETGDGVARDPTNQADDDDDDDTLDMTASDSCVFGSNQSLLQLDLPLS